ncbi:hypothetical protein L21SP2_1535 [Salinispira pacifica]|uniref:Uncharacterized protein n=1 Tax=Salinispira pacifica TaxID=1307761 RepID=V5WGL5_9SPIO|nr:hypothetical protein L21SP2_1535 [Salinispira pacifica]
MKILRRDNGIEDIHMEYHGEIFPRVNIHYSCNIMFPEMILNMIALNELIGLYKRKVNGKKYDFELETDTRTAWDARIAMVRMLQAQFQRAVGRVLSPTSFTRWKNLVHRKNIDIHRMKSPLIDNHNISWLEMDREQREKKLLTLTKRMVEYSRDPDQERYSRIISDAVEEYDCDETDLAFPGIEYPEEINW